MKEYSLTYNQFKQGLREGKLLALKCLNCGNFTTPPNGVCSYCGSLKLETNTISNKGRIKTFTVIRVGPSGFDTPYIVAMVELADGPWVMGNVIGFDTEKADMNLIGKEVTVGHKFFPPDEYEGGIEGLTLTFRLTD